jgi:hypothetical membrane protein
MNRGGRLLRQREFHVFLACLFFILICLPFFIYSGRDERMNMFDKSMFYYFFAIWGLLIILLFLIGRSLRGTAGDAKDDPGGPDV